jgi:hypothetical protein
MQWSEEVKLNLNVALNEASWAGIQVSEDQRLVSLRFSVLTLPADGGPAPDNPSVSLQLQSVSRIVASFRRGFWNDDAAAVETVSLDDLPRVVESFGAQSIYGWEFFDLPESSWAQWANRLSLDTAWASDARAHSIEVFQESLAGPPRHLDLRVWFNELRIFDASGSELTLEEFGQGGKRWWDAFYEHDPRTQGHGMVPGRRDPAGSP